MAGQVGFFDLGEGYVALPAAGDPLEKLPAALGFELFRPVPKSMLRRSDRSKGGRPPYDAVLIFKILVAPGALLLLGRRSEIGLARVAAKIAMETSPTTLAGVVRLEARAAPA